MATGIDGQGPEDLPTIMRNSLYRLWYQWRITSSQQCGEEEILKAVEPGLSAYRQVVDLIQN